MNARIINRLTLVFFVGALLFAAADMATKALGWEQPFIMRVRIDDETYMYRHDAPSTELERLERDAANG